MKGAEPCSDHVSNMSGMGGNRLAQTTNAKISRTFDTLMMTLPTLQAIALAMTSASPALDASPGLHNTMPSNPAAANSAPSNCGCPRTLAKKITPQPTVKNALHWISSDAVPGGTPQAMP